MKVIKLIQIAVVAAAVALLIGCSDQISSPTGSGESGLQSEDLLSANSFSTQISLKPQKSYTFSLSNTGLTKFNSINAEVISSEPGVDLLTSKCADIAIYSNPKLNNALSCQSGGFDVKQITVKNLSSRVIDVRVSLYGKRAKASNRDSE